MPGIRLAFRTNYNEAGISQFEVYDVYTGKVVELVLSARLDVTDFRTLMHVEVAVAPVDPAMIYKLQAQEDRTRIIDLDQHRE